ncbi:MAG: NAD-dependent epimerase/dehydratase family protein, partial [Alphaproteobacteria bacterium]
MRILLTGGAGYIGSHTAWEAIDKGIEVIILDNLSTGVR